VPIRRQLNTVRQAAGQIADKFASRPRVSIPDKPRHDKFSVGIKRRPRPDITNAGQSAHLQRDVLLFRVAEGPDFVALDAGAHQINESAPVIGFTGYSKVYQELEHCALRDARNADSPTD
jgi:hypothetical protein